MAKCLTAVISLSATLLSIDAMQSSGIVCSSSGPNVASPPPIPVHSMLALSTHSLNGPSGPPDRARNVCCAQNSVLSTDPIHLHALFAMSVDGLLDSLYTPAHVRCTFSSSLLPGYRTLHLADCCNDSLFAPCTMCTHAKHAYVGHTLSRKRSDGHHTHGMHPIEVHTWVHPLFSTWLLGPRKHASTLAIWRQPTATQCTCQSWTWTASLSIHAYFWKMRIHAYPHLREKLGGVHAVVALATKLRAVHGTKPCHIVL